MGIEDLEPDQDPLVKEDKASTVFSRVLRGAKNAAPGRSGTDERIYSDPDYTADPDVVARRKAPKMRPDLRERREQGRDADASDADFGGQTYEDQSSSQTEGPKKGRLASLKQMWAEAIAEAEEKQRSKKQSKGK